MRVACVQCDIGYGEPEANVRFAIEELRRLKASGVDLAVFPEAFLTGYCASTPEEARRIALHSGSPHVDAIRRACDEIDILAIVGSTEFENGFLLNVAFLFEPGDEPRRYVKAHLPELGFDHFAKAGQSLDVYDTRLGKIGVLICFDLRFPEASRVLALKGAELIVLPTNWPDGAQVSAEHVAIARAAENRVFVATCNRVGTENGFHFIGRSKIVHPSGRVLAAAGESAETVLADIDLAEARQKRAVTIPGVYETEAFAVRQPELYAPITQLREPTV